MGWNEPPKNPWDGKKGDDNQSGPPDLDEIMNNLSKKASALYQGGGGKNFIIPVVILVFALWLIYSITYFIGEQERGVVLRLGKHVATIQPGLNFRMPMPIEFVHIVNVGKLRSITHKAAMLTQDENIVEVEVAVQYRISNPEHYLFNVNLPDSTLKQIVESAVREIIGKSKLDFVLAEKRQEIAERQKEVIQKTLEEYKIGILISAVKMQFARPPEPVKESFDDVIKAREDKDRLVNEAESYRNDIIPKARGAAARLLEESNAYKARVVAQAEGEASRFKQLLIEYQKAPAITRERLYLDSLESVLTHSNKVLIDTKGGNSLMYLPIDKLIEKRRKNSLTQPDQQLIDQAANQYEKIKNSRSDNRRSR